MKNMILYIFAALTILSGCTGQRESGIDQNFRPGYNGTQDSLQALPSNQSGIQNIPISGTLPYVSQNSNNLTFTLITSPTNGTVNINPTNGSYVYTPNAGYTGVDSFTWQVSSSTKTSQSTVSINVTAINQAPVTSASLVSINEDTILTSNLLGSDPNSDPLTYIIVSPPSHGTVTITNSSTGAYTYTPAANYNGPDSFTFKVNDGQLDSNVSTVSISVTPVNDAPVASNLNLTIPEDSTVNSAVVASDVDSSSLTYSIVSSPNKGVVTLNSSNGTFTYTANANQTGADAFTYKVNDGSLDSNIATVVINITPVNDAPVAASQNVNTNEDQPYSGTLLALDPDSGSLTYSLVANPSHGSVVITNAALGTFTYVPNANFNGVDSFTFKANDGSLDSNVAAVNITVNPINDPPVANNLSFAINSGSTYSSNLSASDVDSPSLTFVQMSSPTKGTVSVNSATGSFSYTANVGSSGTDVFSFRVNDGLSNSNIATVTININSVNQPPVANSQTITIPEDSVLTGNLGASDPDSSSVSFSLVSFTTKGVVTLTNAATGAYSYTPNANETGVDSFTFKVNDGQLDSNIATITINITPVNDAPVALPQSVATSEDTPISGILIATDVDSPTLTYSIATNPSNGSVVITNPATGSYTYTPNANYIGPDSFSFKANDGSLNSNIALVTISVNSDNDAPIANNQSITIPEDSIFSGNLTGSDADSVSLTFIKVSNPSKGSVTITNASTGAFTYTPNANATGADSFTFKISDGTSDSNIATVSINITPINDAPVAFNGSFSVNQGQSQSGNLIATDIDSSSLTYTIVGSPTKGTVSVNPATGAFTYTANLIATGTDTFTFKVNDGQLDSNIATMVVNLNQTNLPPVASNGSIITNEDTPVSGNLLAVDANLDPLTFTIVSQGGKGVVAVNPTTGAFTYTPNANASGVDSFTFKANDGISDSNIANVVVTIVSINDAPIANNQSFTTPEDTIYNGVLTGSDVDGDAITYSIVSQGSKGLVVLLNPATGAYSYTPNANATGSDSFTFRVNDGTLNSNVATVSVTINSANDAPVANNLNFTSPEDVVLNQNLLANDVDSPSLTYSIVSMPSNGTISVNASTGAFTYTPNLNFNGSDSFTYKVNDGSLDSNIATVSLTITPVNDAPIAFAQNFAVNQAQSYSGTLIATDVDGNSLTYSIVGLPTKGVVTITNAATGAFTYTANALVTGVDSFTFKVNDGQLDSNIPTVTVNLNQNNNPPIANNGNLTVIEDTPTNGNLTGSDLDADTLTYSLVTPPTKGSVVITNALTGAYTYTPNSNATGSDSFTFKISDGTSDSNVATISINITPVNDAPVALNGNLAVVEDTATNGTLLATDVDSVTLTYSLVTPPTKGVVIITNSTTGAYTYTPNLNAQGVDSFTFKANDGSLDSNVATININIASVNDAPIAQGQSLTTPEETSLTGTLVATDVDSAVLTYSLVTLPTKGVVTITNVATGAFTYTPAANQVGVDSFTFKANDGTADSNIATININITPVNDAPVAQNLSLTTLEDTVLSNNLLATDVDSSSLTYSIVAQGSKGVVVITNASTGAFTYTPNANATGADSFTFKANDGSLDSNIATVSINITPVNDAPIANNQNLNTPEDTPVNGILTGSDIDSSSLNYLLVTAPTNGTVVITNAATGAFTYNPAANFSGSDSFTFKINDGSLDSNIATVSINVSNLNDAPIALNDVKTINEDTPVNIVLMASDVENSPLTYTVLTSPTKGVLSGTAPNLTYTPNLNQNGVDTFTFKVNDGSLDSNIATITINITPVNDAPIANNQSLAINEDTPVSGNLTGSDVDSSSLTYALVSNPTNGSVVVNASTGAFTYTPNSNYTGLDSFTFKVNDGSLDSNVATVSISVSPINDAPVALNDTKTTNEDTPVAIILMATDPENNSLTYTLLTSPTKGLLSGTAPNLTYTPNLNQNGVDTFTFRVNDGSLNSNVATVTININPINDAPIANNGSFVTNKNVAYSGNLTGSDIEGSALSYSIVSNPANGSVVVNASTGAYTYTPNSNYSGTDSFTFRVNDGSLNSNVATISITVTNPNTAPVAISQSYQVTEDTPYGGNMQANDPQGDSLTYTVITQPTKGTLTYNSSNGTFTYTPNLNYNGADSFTFKVNDGQLDSNVATISFTVNPINDPPAAQGQTVTVNQNSSNNPITLVGTDVESSPLTYTIVANPQYGTLSGSGANRTYTPNANYFGPDSFTFKVNDGSLDSNVATVSINVNDLGGWCNVNFNYAHKLLLNNQDQSSILVNFPVMIKLNSARVNYADIKTGGADLRFYDSNCNQLAHEIERWNPSGDSTIWVKVPSIAASSNASFIWMQYGNSAANDVQNKNAVWSNSFAATWHAEETSGNNLNDSTSNSNHLVKFGTPVQNTAGRVAGGDLLDTSDDGYVESAESASLRITNNITLESWAYITSCSGDDHIIEKYYISGSSKKKDYALFVNSCKAKLRIGTKYVEYGTALPLNQWIHIAGTYESASNKCTIYINGVLKASSTSCSETLSGAGGYKMTIGNDFPAANYFNGAFDEVRISSVARSADWIRAQHLSMTDGMVSYGTKRSLGQKWNHILMTIKSNNDDGKIYVPGNGLYINGHNGIVYQGSNQNKGVWGYYRFQLPNSIPSNAVIKKAMIRLYGRDKSSNWNSHYLTVGLQNSSNASVVSNANQYPGGPGGITQGPVENWGAPALSWKLDDWNDSQNFKNSFTSLINTFSGLSNNNYVQVWVTRPLDGNTNGIELGSEDNYYETINHGQLMIEWE